MHLKEDDRLFGILSEDQVGMDPNTEKLKMAPDVLHEMRQYLMEAEGAERKIKEDRIRSSIASLDNDPMGQKTNLCLEPAPLISLDVDKGKGLVYDFQGRGQVSKIDQDKAVAQKLLASAIQSGNAMKRTPTLRCQKES